MMPRPSWAVGKKRQYDMASPKAAYVMLLAVSANESTRTRTWPSASGVSSAVCSVALSSWCRSTSRVEVVMPAP
jgi:hypothetical protein